MSEGAYWCLSVPTDVCGRFLVSEDVYWCLRETTGV